VRLEAALDRAHAPVQTLDQLRKRGAQLVGEVVQYQDSYRLSRSVGLKGSSSD
jgi:hypothetical protein